MEWCLSQFEKKKHLGDGNLAINQDEDSKQKKIVKFHMQIVMLLY